MPVLPKSKEQGNPKPRGVGREYGMGARHWFKTLLDEFPYVVMDT